MRRAAFTLVELLVVIGIAVVLMAMAAPGVLGAVRKSAAYHAAGRIEGVIREARLLAITRRPEGDRCFGAILAWDAAANRYYAALIAGSPGDGKADDRAREWTQSGSSVTRRELPDGFEVLVDGTPLSGQAQPWLAWYFRNASGVPVAMTASAWARGTLSVGLAPDAQATPSDLWGISGYNPALDALAPGGLLLQAPGGSPKASIKLLPSGAVVVDNA